MTYRGFPCGRVSAPSATMRQKSSLDSPPARPPIAYPGKSRSTSCAALSRLNSGSSPPCTMPKRFCSCGLECALIHLSIQRVVRCVASKKRAGSFAVVGTTSSKAMMMSAPNRFWMPMDSSGVKSISVPSTGDWKVTPSSLISAKCSSETIWKPPESVSMPRGHDTNSCSPPIEATKSLPGLFCKWYVLPRITWQSRSSSCCGVIPLTVP
mmetsp:Transcript_25528/g.69288  ORF Transcript_25528/g.69288 Transcript_25528/m.69288 type:complete len:210 (-) Transcript_25528:241-870(-)